MFKTKYIKLYTVYVTITREYTFYLQCVHRLVHVKYSPKIRNNNEEYRYDFHKRNDQFSSVTKKIKMQLQ